MAEAESCDGLGEYVGGKKMMAGIAGLLKLFDRRFVKLENFSSLEGGGVLHQLFNSPSVTRSLKHTSRLMQKWRKSKNLITG